MKLKNGLQIDTYVKDSSGDQAFVLWIANTFQPRTYLVRGEDFMDAYEWFLCDPRVEEELRIDKDPRLAADYTVSLVTFAGRVLPLGWREDVEYNENGTPLDAESVNGCPLEDFARPRD